MTSKPKLTELAVRVHPGYWGSESDECRCIEVNADNLGRARPEVEAPDAEWLAIAVYLGSVLARVDVAIRAVAESLYESHGKGNVFDAPASIVGDIYCRVASAYGYPDPCDEGSPQLVVYVHGKRWKWWVGVIKRALATIEALDTGAEYEWFQPREVAKTWPGGGGQASAL